MKNLILLSLLFASPLAAQVIEYLDVSPQYGYHFGGRARFYEGDLKIDDAPTYGITLSAPVDWGIAGEFTFSRSDSRARFIPYRGGYEREEVEVASTYFQVGAMKEFITESIIPFGGITLGVGWLDVKDPEIYDAVRFAFSLGGGLKYMITDHIGIRAQGRFLFPVFLSGGGFYYGIGGGSGITLTSTSVIVQGDISAGLVFRLGGVGDY